MLSSDELIIKTTYKEITNLVTFLSVSESELFSHWDEESIEVDDGIWRGFLMSFLIKAFKMFKY